MNYIDLLLIVVMLLCIWENYSQGFILSALGLLSWTGSLIMGFNTYTFISKLMLRFFPATGIWATPLSFILAVIISKLLFDLIINVILYKTPGHAHKLVINKVFGIIPGIINGLIWTALLSGLLLLMPFNNSISKQTRSSKLADRLSDKVSWLDAKLSPVFSEALSHVIPANSVEVSKEKPVDLPFSVKNPRVRPDVEAAMLVLVNRERVQRGLKLLKADPELTIVARKHSVDMFARGYFSHYTPEGINPFGRMRADGIQFLTAGENLALAQTLAIAHKGLMNSPGHRSNILNPTFGRLGIGIEDGGIYGLMITQNFRN
ncbi:CvpA family protein [Mucilaginibacter sp.]|jgi:uncharacterized protein YkwD|uniref:CvpA family protein n=1 Tax=Mucilaginibacter sp. TaxID=1882438 RepID=UPI00356AC2BB